MKIKAYVSGVLTGGSEIESLKHFYEQVAAVCMAEGIDAYVPHLVSDPTENPGMSPEEVYDIDRRQVLESNLLIAYVGLPSLGVGQEIEIAREKNIPVVLLMEKDRKISRMARGNPVIIAEIHFSDFEDALSQLAAWLREWKS
jgi:2'-deoxynucleoside 5'-phosphate N-hydrolase